MMLWGLWSHYIGLAVLATLGSLYAGLASFGGLQHTRLRVMFGATMLMAFVTLVGGFVSLHPIGAMAAVFVLAFLMALYAPTSATATTVAIQSTAVLVVIAGFPATSAHPIGNALLVLAGGFLQMALVSVIPPDHPMQTERKVVADVFLSLAEYVRDLPEHPEQRVPATAAYQEAWNIMSQSARHSWRTEHTELRNALRAAEALRASLVGFGQADAALRASGPDGIRQADETAREIEAEFDAIADAIMRGLHPWETDRDAPSTETLASPGDTSSEHTRWAVLIMNILREAKHLPSVADEAEIVESRRQRVWTFGQTLRRRLDTLKSSLDLRSLTTRHALRYGTAISLSVGLSHVLPLSRPFWLPLTVALVLRADYAATIQRGFARLMGTLIGVVLAGALAYLLHPSQVGLVIMTILGAWMAFAFYGTTYVYFTMAVTVYVIFSVSSTGLHGRTAVFDRVEATVIGAIIAVVTNLVWPIWQSRQVRGILLDALSAQIRYGEALLAGSDEATLDEKRHVARSLRYEAERITASARHEPFWSRVHLPASTQAVLTHLHDNAAQLLILHGEALQARYGQPSLTGDVEARTRAILEDDRRLEARIATDR